MIDFASRLTSFMKRKAFVNYTGYRLTLDEFYTYLQKQSSVLSALPPVRYMFAGKIGDGFNANSFTVNQITLYVGKNMSGTEPIDTRRHHFSQNEITVGYIAIAHECEHIKQLHDFQTNPNVDRYDIYQHICEYGFHESYNVPKNYKNNPLELKAERNALLVAYDYLQTKHEVSSQQAFEMIQSAVLERIGTDDAYLLPKTRVESFRTIDDFTKAFDEQLETSKDACRCIRFVRGKGFCDDALKLCSLKSGSGYATRKEYEPVVKDITDHCEHIFAGHDGDNIGFQFLEKAATLTLHFDPCLKSHYRGLDNVDTSLVACFGDVASDIRDPAPCTIDMTKSGDIFDKQIEKIRSIDFIKVKPKENENVSKFKKRQPKPLSDVLIEDSVSDEKDSPDF